MKITTWNVNSLRARQGHLLDWLKANPVDAIGLQELKMQDEHFPRAEIEAMGYQAAISGQKAYNGVAILSRHALEDVHRDIPGFADEQKRVIAATVRGVRIVNLYVPNGQTIGSEKYAYKLRWLGALREYLGEELARHPQLVVTGDFNVAPTDADVHDPLAWAGQVLCSEPERAAFRALLELGLQDSFTRFPAPEQRFTWWDYRQGAFRRGRGLRIDHILVSPEVSKECQSFHIDTVPRELERPSDHTPVTLSFRGL